MAAALCAGLYPWIQMELPEMAQQRAVHAERKACSGFAQLERALANFCSKQLTVRKLDEEIACLRAKLTPKESRPR